MNNDKSILLIPLYYDTEKEYKVKWEKRFIRNCGICENKYDKSLQNELRDLTLAIDPISHRFNNILGYAELFVDYHDILIYYHLNGDRRKKYNKQDYSYLRRTKSKIYPAFNHEYGGSFFKVDNMSIRKAIDDSLQEVENQCKEWGIMVEIELFREKLKYFDFKQFFEDKGWC